MTDKKIGCVQHDCRECKDRERQSVPALPVAEITGIGDRGGFVERLVHNGDPLKTGDKLFAAAQPGVWPIDGDIAKQIADEMVVSYEVVQLIARRIIQRAPQSPQPQPVQQGPVARVRFSDHAFDYVDWIPYQGQPLKDGDLLYTSPQAPQPQPVQQEPVGWIDAKALEELEKQEMNWMPVWNRQNGISPIALYTSPQAAQPLTETQADALNTLCKMLHSGEEVEGDDGLAMLVPIDLWNEAQDAIELLISEDDGTEAAHGVTKGTT